MFASTFNEIDALRREVEKAFEVFRAPGGGRASFLPARSPRNYPLVNVAEDENAIVVEALAPGLDASRIQIQVLRNQLTVSGEKTATTTDVKGEDYHRSERATGRFVRTFTLPAEVDETKVAAEYANGILTITLPKAESAKPRQITVTVA